MYLYEKLLGRALRLIAKKRYTFAEMEQKLEKAIKKYIQIKKLHIPVGEQLKTVNKVLERLKELKYLDDKQFANDFISDRVRFRPRGIFLLRQELTKKGIDKEIIASALLAQIKDESLIAAQVLSKCLKKWQKYTVFEQRKKAFAYLGSRGFSVDAIYKAIEAHYNQHIDES